MARWHAWDRSRPPSDGEWDARRGWLTIAMLFAFMDQLRGQDKAVFGLSAVRIMGELHLTHTQFGLIGTSFFLLFSAAAAGVNTMKSAT